VVLEGRYADATQILKGAFETQTLSKRDPRVQQLVKKIKEAKAAAAANAAPQTTEPVEEPATPQSDSSEYVSPQGAPVREASRASSESTAAEVVNQDLSATLVSGPVPRTDPQTTVIFRTREAVQWEQEHLGPDDEAPEAVPAESAAVPASAHAVQFFRDYPFPIGAAAVVFVVAILLTFFYVSNASARADVALRNKAQQLEQQKNWPAALAAFESLAGTNRALAIVGRENADRLKKLLDQENSLFARAQDSEAARKLSDAKTLYEDAANLHGDREPQAVAAIAALNSKLTPPEPSQVISKRGQHVATVPAGKSQTSQKQTPKTPAETCQLIPSDVVRRLDRADRLRGDGHYADAERLYRAVLACQPDSDRAKNGLNKAIIGQQTDGKVAPSN